MNRSAASSFEEQHEKNMRVLGLIRDEPAWALSRILLAERLEAAVREYLNDIEVEGISSTRILEETLRP